MVLINMDGEIVGAIRDTQGVVMKADDFIYVCKYYSEEQSEMFKRLRDLRENLNSTDYKAIKYSDGALTEEQYAPVRVQRQVWRDEINKIENEFHPPVFAEKEIEQARAAFLFKHPEIAQSMNMVEGGSDA